MATAVSHANGLMSPNQVEKSLSGTKAPTRLIVPDGTSRILCVADIRGDCELEHHSSLKRGKEGKVSRDHATLN
jgi:hypothetical protein